MATRARQNELVQLQADVSNEITRDAPHIARMVFGDNATHPDMAQVQNERLDDVYRQAYQRGDRAWLQSEARRDPEQFLKVAERIGVRIPPPSPPPPPAMPAIAPLPVAPPPPVVAPAPVPVAAAVGPPPMPAAPPPLVAGPPPGPAPVILGPNGMPLPPSVPQMAQGGIVTQPTLAVIGEAGPEAIVPLAGAPGPSAVLQQQPTPVRVGQGPDEFVSSLTPLARQAEQQTGLPADVYLAMAANETGWGRSQTAQQNNLFSVQGPTGGANRWASYETPMQSFQSLASLLSTEPRYAAAWAARGDPQQFLNEMRKAGYVADEPGFPAQNWVNQVYSIYNELQARRAREQG